MRTARSFSSSHLHLPVFVTPANKTCLTWETPHFIFPSNHDCFVCMLLLRVSTGHASQHCRNFQRVPGMITPPYFFYYTRYICSRAVSCVGFGGRHGFPDAFGLPACLTLAQRYGLIDNSVSVDIVALLLRRVLFQGDTTRLGVGEQRRSNMPVPIEASYY